MLRVGFCNHRDTVTGLDGRGRMMFTPFFSSLKTKAERREWLTIAQDAGETGMAIARNWDYPEVCAQNQVDAGMLSREVFVERLVEIHDFGMIPCVHGLADQQAIDMAMIYDGRMEAELRPLAPIAHLLGFVSIGWEVVGSWKSKAICDAGTLHRQVLGPKAIISCHGDSKQRFTGASYHGLHEKGAPVAAGLRHMPAPEWVEEVSRGVFKVFDGTLVEADDPVLGDEVGWWNAPGAREFDLFQWQADHGRNGPSYQDVGGWLPRLIEGWERFAPSGTFMRALGRMVRTPDLAGDIAPDWFAGNARPRGRPRMSPYELVAVEYSRGWIGDDRVAHVNRILGGYGFTDFGNGVPRP